MTEEKDTLVKQVFRKWEKWRLPYNFVLVISLLIRQPPQWVWFDALLFGNLLYFLGPAIEGYVEWLGNKSNWFMPVAYGTGILISIYTVFFFY